ARTELHPGRLLDGEGNEVGRVDAVELVTVGQRRGLGLSGGGEHRYAVAVDIPTRTVRVGRAEELATATTDVDGWEWSAEPSWGAVAVQTSAHGTARAATIEPAAPPGRGVVRWAEPVRRVAPGQAVVAYDPSG